jgi:type IV secretory pathway TrbF-like protein
VQRYGRTPEPETPYQRAGRCGTSGSAPPASRPATGG